MKNYNKAAQKQSGGRNTYLQMLEDEEERRRRERQQGATPGLTTPAGTYKPAGSKGAGSMPGPTNQSDTYRPAGAAGGGSSQVKTAQPKTANMFYTDAPKSGTIAPRFNSIAAYNKAIEEGNKKLDELAHKQFQAMLQNDVPGMDALEKQYKDTKKHLDVLKAELGEVMGAGIHGKKGNQLTGSGWFGRKMDELAVDGTAMRVTQLNDDPEPSPPPLPGPPPSEDLEDYNDQWNSLYSQHSAWEKRMYNKLEEQYAPEKQRRIETMTYKPTAEFVWFILKGLQSAVSNLNQALSTGNPAMIAHCKKEADMYQAVSDMILNPSDDNWTLYNQMGKGLKALEEIRDSGGSDKELELIQDQIIAINRGMNVVGEAYLDEVDQKFYASKMEQSDFEKCKSAYRAYYQTVIDRERSIEINSRSLKEGNLILANASKHNIAVLDVLEALDVPLYSTEKDAVFAFKKEAMPLTLQNEREYSAILDSIELLNTETGEVQTYYYYLDIKPGDKDNVIFNALLGAGGDENRKLLHTHPVDGGWNRYFSGDPANQGIINNNFFRNSEFGEMGDSNVPTTLGYGGIYVVGSGGEVKLYEGEGDATIGSGNNTHANNKFELKYVSTIDLY